MKPASLGAQHRPVERFDRTSNPGADHQGCVNSEINSKRDRIRNMLLIPASLGAQHRPAERFDRTSNPGADHQGRVNSEI